MAGLPGGLTLPSPWQVPGDTAANLKNPQGTPRPGHAPPTLTGLRQDCQEFFGINIRKGGRVWNLWQKGLCLPAADPGGAHWPKPLCSQTCQGSEENTAAWANQTRPGTLQEPEGGKERASRAGERRSSGSRTGWWEKQKRRELIQMGSRCCPVNISIRGPSPWVETLLRRISGQ